MIPLWNFHLLKRVILIGPDEEAFSRVEPEIQGKGGVFEQGEASGNGRGGSVCICKQNRWENAAVVYFHRQRCSLRGRMQTQTGARGICG